MKINAEKIDDITIVYFESNLTTEWNTETQNLLSPLIEDPNCNGMILDFKDVQYVDSSDLGLIVSIYKALTKYSKKFILSNINTSIKEVLNLTRLDEILLVGTDINSSIQLLKEN